MLPDVYKKLKEGKMVNRENVKDAAFKFLKAIAVKAKKELGTNTKVSQRSSWMVKTSATSSSSQLFERKVFNSRAVDMMYQLDRKTDFLEKERLKEITIEAGFKPEQIEYGLLLTLVRAWLDVSNPLDIGGEDVRDVIEKFSTTIIDKIVETRSRYALIGMDERSEEVILDDEVSLRRISDEELWEFGQLGSVLSPASITISGVMLEPLSESWMILEINRKHGIDEADNSNMLKDTVLINMSMSSRGHFRVINLGIKKNTWFGGSTHIGDRADRSINILGGGRYLVDAEVKKRMTEGWPQVLQIIESDNYLKLPAERLLEGLGRWDLKDSVIDYAIGLEVLLTKQEPNMSYRFALRGTHIINWDGGSKSVWFKKLDKFYGTRNAIVHGGSVNREQLIAESKVGAEALKEVWMWYARKRIDSAKNGLTIVDDKIIE